MHIVALGDAMLRYDRGQPPLARISRVILEI